MLRNRTVSPKKLEEVKIISDLIKKYNVIGLAHLTKMPAKSLHNLRGQLRGDVVIHMTKKKLFQRAFKDAGKENLNELGNMANGITGLLFTNMNPIKLAKYLKSKAVKGPAKGGDLAPNDIMVQAGDTKISPGPIISEINQSLKVQTLIKNGTIHIRADTVTHKKGEVINEKAAQLLARLGIEPMTIEMDFYAAWENGEIISDAVLHMDDEKLIKDFVLGAAQGLNIALSLGVITDETVSPLIQKAARESIALGMELPIIIEDLMPQYIQKASAEATVLNNTAFGVASSSTSAADSKQEKKEEKKAEKSKSDDENMGEGISNLFD